MRQVLFYIPLGDFNLPIYCYGLMLFLAFVLCSSLAGRLARRERVDPQVLPDLAIWLFVTGIAGGRIAFVIQEWPSFADDPLRIVKLWDGGLILYGAIIGGTLGYFLAYRWLLAPANISSWKMADILAPCIALGVALGRIGCFMTGCCWGNVACADCPTVPVSFPLPSYPARNMAELGYQTLAGFIVDPSDLEITGVEPGSPAALAGVQQGDRLVKVNNVDLTVEPILKSALLNWPPGVHVLQIAVQRGGQVIELPAFVPVSLPLYPTQLFETTSMLLMVFLLLSFYPFKKLDGSVMVLLMFGYAIHRFLNEALRIDNPIIALGMTISQLISLVVLLGAIVLAYFVFVRRASVPKPASVAIAPVNTW